MNHARAVVGMDRLPWLTDEPRPRERPKSSSPRELLGWAVAGLLFIAGGSYWLGTRSGPQPAGPAVPIASTVKLPDARASAPTIAEAAEVEPAAPPVAEAPRARVESPARRQRAVPRKRRLSPMELDGSELSRTVARQRSEPARKAKAAAVTPARPTAARSSYPRLWPASVSDGAYGRVVRIGSFGSRAQAKLGWRRMQRAYPAVGRLPATVVTDRNSRGRAFYRFQIGTTSQAHSEVLCQRMARIRFSCAVVGLPWKAKVER